MYRASYGALPITTVFSGDGETASARASAPVADCAEETTAQLVPVLPPFVLQCVMNGAHYSEGSASCTPNTARASNTIEFFIPQVPAIPTQFIRFEWDVLGATVLGGCGANNHTCVISGPASNVGDRGFLANVTVVDTRWDTWRTNTASALLPAVCGRQFC